MPDWDANGPQLAANLKRIARKMAADASARGSVEASLAKRWHTEMMVGLSAPDPAFVGAFRGEPGLERIGVKIGGLDGAAPHEVDDQVRAFERRLKTVIEALDDDIAPGAPPRTADTLDAVLDLCAWAHAEWVRIHPFANGNGRTARMWANYIAMRYGVPPFVTLRPRPPGRHYANAGRAAMLGQWEPTARLFKVMLERFLSEN